MMFAHIHSTKEKLYGLFNLHVQLDITIGGNNTDLDVYEKEEMFRSEAAATSATLVHTLAQAFPMCFNEEADHSLFIVRH